MTQTKRSTLSNVNKAIADLDVFLVKGDGYFYIVGNRAETVLKVAALKSTSIPVYKISDLTIGGWRDEVVNLLATATDPDRYPLNETITRANVALSSYGFKLEHVASDKVGRPGSFDLVGLSDWRQSQITAIGDSVKIVRDDVDIPVVVLVKMSLSEIAKVERISGKEFYNEDGILYVAAEVEDVETRTEALEILEYLPKTTTPDLLNGSSLRSYWVRSSALHTGYNPDGRLYAYLATMGDSVGRFFEIDILTPDTVTLEQIIR